MTKNSIIHAIAIAVAILQLYCPATFADRVNTCPIENLDMRRGLSNNYVTDVCQDTSGAIWIATESGLNRFDGNSFSAVSLTEAGIPDQNITSLHFDRKEERLWVGTKSGLAVLQLPGAIPVDMKWPEDLKHYNITDITPASDGGIWITNHYESIAHYSPDNGIFTVYTIDNVKGLPNDFLTAADDGHGKLMIGHFRYGLSIVDMKTKKLTQIRANPQNPNGLPSDRVRTIYKDSFNNIWIGTGDGLAHYDSRNGFFTTFRHSTSDPSSIAGNAIYAITETPDGNMWIGSDIGGISIVPARELGASSEQNPPRFRNINATNDGYGVASKNIRSIFNDSFGNMWIGNFSSGLDFIPHSRPMFSQIEYYEFVGKGTRDKAVWSLLATSTDGDFIAGGENEIAFFHNGELIKTKDITPWLTRPYDRVEHLAHIGDKILIGLDNNGVLEMDVSTHDIRRVPMPQTADKPMNSFTVVDDNTVFIGTEDGLYIYHNGVITRPDKVNKILNWLSVNSVATDRDGKIWVGTYGGGLFVFSPKFDLICKLDRKSGLPSDVINHVVSDSRGYMWAATSKGIVYFENISAPSDKKYMKIPKNLTDKVCRGIAEDPSGDIWISTDRSVSKWNRRSGEISNFDYRAGLPHSLFMSRAVAAAPDSMVYFGSINGIWRANAGRKDNRHDIPPVIISGCEWLPDENGIAGDHMMSCDKDNTLDIPYDHNSFRISFAVPDYTLSKSMEYEYMMEGLDDKWHSTQDLNYVIFRNLPPGKYTFKVRAHTYDSDDVSETSMRIRVVPPIWRTWYAYLLYLLIIAMIVVELLRMRDRRVKRDASMELELRNTQAEQRINNERLKFFTNISHELRTPLTLIIGPLEDLSHNPEMPEKFHRKLDMVYKSAQGLLELVNKLLEFRKTETKNRRLMITTDNISTLVTETGLKFKEFNDNPDVEVKIDVEKGMPCFAFDREIVRTIINNLMSNALKYTPDGTVTIGVRAVTESDPENVNNGRQYAEVYVSDTGLGISSEDLSHIFERFYRGGDENIATGTGIGLSFSKSLADLHKAEILVESVEGEGSVFRLRLDMDETYPEADHKMTKTDTAAEYDPDKENTHPLLLIVEDNANIREYVKESFDGRFRVETAADGNEGLAKARAETPDIIISDVMMPGMDGVEMCRRLKTDIATSHIPVVLLTAKDSIEDKEEGYQAGAESYITKPFSARLLSARIDNIIVAHRRMAQRLNTPDFRIADSGEQQIDKSTENDGFHEEDTGNDSAEEIRPHITRLDREFLEKFEKLVNENLQNTELGVALVADKLNMSKSTVYRKLLTLTGMVPVKLIRQLRLKHAGKLIGDGYNVGEAAYSSGFNDMGYFRTCFKEYFGVTPSAYKKNGK